MKKIRCFLGFHKMETIGVSEYRYSTGIFTHNECRGLVKKCKHCETYDVPPWYKKEYRLLKPYVDIHGVTKEWKPEFTI